MSQQKQQFQILIDLIIIKLIITLWHVRNTQCIKPVLNMKKLICTLLALVLTTQVLVVQAQDEAFEELTMNGLASFSKLRKEYYVGALYLESLSADADSIINMEGKKRMEIRIAIKKWSPRRFSKQWNEAIYLNNDPEIQEEFADQIQAFIDIPQDDLKAGNIITIDMDPDTGTIVYLDGQRILKSSNNAFFYVILNTWIGSKPPSSDFKQNMLALPTDSAGTELLVKFDGLGYEESRKKQIAAWSKPAKKESSAAAPVTLALAASAAALPPSSTGTTVKAKSTKQAAKPKSVAKAPVTAPDTTKPVMDIEKPQLAKAAPPAPKPEPKPAAKPAPKAEPKPEPKQEVAKAPEPAAPTAEELEAQKQEGLRNVYRSNILKLTYQNTIYPKRSISLGHQGLVVYKVTLNRKGKLLGLEEEKVADHSLLNKAARKAIKKASPFPQAPDDLKGDKFVFSLPFNFKL